MDVAGPSTECGSAVNACFHTYIPVEPSTSSGCLYSQAIDDNDVTFDFPLEELQMQVNQPNMCKHTRDVGCQVNTQLKETFCFPKKHNRMLFTIVDFKPSTKINYCRFESGRFVTLFWKFQGVWKTQIANSE